MDKLLKQYYKLKQQQKELDDQLSGLRTQILAYCAEQGAREVEAGGYKARIVVQERKEYDSERLYAALPDLQLWKLLSKPDPGKINGLLKINAISEAQLAETYDTREVLLLQVERK